MTPFQNLIFSVPNYIYLSIIFLCCALPIIDWLVPVDNVIYNVIGQVFGYVTIGFIFKNGQFHNSKMFRYLLLTIALVLIGALFLILHWPYSKLFLSISITTVAMIYGLYFVQKNRKTVTDIFKLLFLLSLIISKIIKFNHLNHLDFILTINFITTIITVTLIFRDNKNSKTWIYT